MASNVLGYKIALDWSGTASEALGQYRGVVIDFDAGTVAYPAGVTSIINGVTLVAAASGEQVQVALLGVVPVKITTSGSIVAGDNLSADANGGFVESATTNKTCVQALNAPTGNGDIILAMLTGVQQTIA